MTGKYYYLISSLPTLEVDGEEQVTIEQFLYEAEKWLSRRDRQIILAADIRNGDVTGEKNELLKNLISRDLRLRARLAGIRASFKKGEAPRVPEDLKAVMEAGDPLRKEMELAKLRWGFLDEMAAEHFFDINWLVIYFLKVQILERLNSFDKDKGEDLFYKLCEVQYEQAIR